MSAEATGWVYRYSPFKGAAFQVHHAIADSVNDQGGYEFWMRQGVCATKARVGRQTVNDVLAILMNDGFLRLVREGKGGANRYVFLFPEVPVVFESRPQRGVGPDDRGVSALTTSHVGAGDRPVGPDDTEPNRTQGEPKVENPSPSSRRARRQTPPEVDALCERLADAIKDHRGGEGRPTVTRTWKNDMRLLVECGPLGVSDGKPIPPERVIKAIEVVFSRLADPDGNGFCWASQIQSPLALRRQWVKLVEAAKVAGSRRLTAAEVMRRRAAEAEPNTSRLRGSIFDPATAFKATKEAV